MLSRDIFNIQLCGFGIQCYLIDIKANPTLNEFPQLNSLLKVLIILCFNLILHRNHNFIMFLI